jgi:uncharacterized protein YutE (UPF0331/DUF86 family)
LQVLAENSIGKAKQLLKSAGKPVPVSEYNTFDSFDALCQNGMIEPEQLKAWKAIVGMRNRIVHDYMNVDIDRVQAWVAEGQHRFVADFLRYDSKQGTMK